MYKAAALELEKPMSKEKKKNKFYTEYLTMCTIFEILSAKPELTVKKNRKSFFFRLKKLKITLSLNSTTLFFIIMANDLII